MKTRMRRGMEVTIPENWIGNFTTSKTIHDRKIAAKLKRKERRKQYKFQKDLPLE